MIRTKILFKLSVLLMTSCLSTEGITSDRNGHDLFTASGGKSADNATFDSGGPNKTDYETLFKALDKLYDVPVRRISEQNFIQNLVDAKLTEFFVSFPEESNVDGLAAYLDWLFKEMPASTAEQTSMWQLDTPLWGEFYMYFVSKEGSIVPKSELSLMRPSVASVVKSGSSSLVAKRGLRKDEPYRSLKTPRGEFASGYENDADDERDEGDKDGKDTFDKGNSLQGNTKKSVSWEISVSDTLSSPSRLPRLDLRRFAASKAKATLPASRKIAEYLNQFIIGQEEAMSSLAMYIHRHYAALKHNKVKTNVHYEKSNILMIGHTGCGKTASVEYIRDFLHENNLDVKLVLGSASSLTRTGYVGQSASSLIKNALIENKLNVAATENNTIIFIDEIDKICAKTGGGERDIAGADVQAELLRYLQGERVKVSIENGMGGKTDYTVDTANILFICAGAFDGLEVREQEVRIAVKEPEQETSVCVTEAQKVGSEAANLVTDATTGTATGTGKVKKVRPKFPKEIIEKRHSVPDEALALWLKREFIGRVHNHILFKPMSKAGLRRILTEPVNSIINQVTSLLASEELWG